MSRGVIVVVIAIALALGVVSCQKMPSSADRTGTLRLEAVKLVDTIPAEYGELVAVTSSDTFPGWAQLWFRKEDQTIVTVFLNFQNGEVRQQVLVIPRS